MTTECMSSTRLESSLGGASWGNDASIGKIVWLASFPKSGNTWVKAFLHNLIYNQTSTFDLSRISEFVTLDSNMRWFRGLDPRPWQQWRPAEINAMRRASQERICASSERDIFVKTHNARLSYRGQQLAHADVTQVVIYVIRNPLDVCISFSHHFGVGIDEAIALIADRTTRMPTNRRLVHEFRSSWSAHVASWTDTPIAPILILRYEDLHDRPAEEFRRLIRFAGLAEFEPRFEVAMELASFANLSRLEQETGFKEKGSHNDRFFRVGRAGQWRNILGDHQIDAIVNAHREQMAQFGYWPLPK